MIIGVENASNNHIPVVQLVFLLIHLLGYMDPYHIAYYPVIEVLFVQV